MSHALSIQQQGTYLHIKVTGDNNPQDILEYLAEVRTACREKKYPYVLLEENLTGPGLDTVVLYDVISRASLPSPDVRCMAYVDINPEHDITRLKFGETVASNRGMTVKVFANLAEAEIWLNTFISDSGGSKQ